MSKILNNEDIKKYSPMSATHRDTINNIHSVNSIIDDITNIFANVCKKSKDEKDCDYKICEYNESHKNTKESMNG